MQLRLKMEGLVREMIDGRITLDEAVSEFEKLYIQEALKRNEDHLSNTAASLGIHRNTLSKKVSGYAKTPLKRKKLVTRKRK